MRLLVTRPEPGASATAARLRAMGHEPIFAPCLAITPLDLKLSAPPAALIITSGQAVQALPASLAAVPAFCVGDATANRLRAAGFLQVESAGADAAALFRLITARRLPGLHLLAVGERQGLALARQLNAAGISTIRRKVYRATFLRAMPDDVRAALAAGEIDAALFYSTETARAFVRLNPPGTGGMFACALSPGVAVALHGLPWREIRVALAPTEADLMALLT